MTRRHAIIMPVMMLLAMLAGLSAGVAASASPSADAVGPGDAGRLVEIRPNVYRAQGALPSQGCKVYYPAGERITLATAAKDSDCWDSGMLAKANRTFMGWTPDAAKPDAHGKAQVEALGVESVITMPAHEMDVYAAWAADPTLTYDPQPPAGHNVDSTPASETVGYDQPAHDTSGWSIGQQGLVRGHSFQGWNGHGYTWGDRLTDDTTVTGMWRANGYRIVFHANGGDGRMDDQQMAYDQSAGLHANTFARHHHRFTGWNLKTDGKGTGFGDGQNIRNLAGQDRDGDTVDLYAQWRLRDYTIHYDANSPNHHHNGQVPDQKATYDTDVTVSHNDYSTEGYAFKEWNTKSDGSGITYTPGQTTRNICPDDSDQVTVYAVWRQNLSKLPSTGGRQPAADPRLMVPAGIGMGLIILGGLSMLLIRMAPSRGTHAAHGRHVR